MITSSVGAELSPPTHGAHRVPIGWGSLPRKRTSFSRRGFSFVSAHLRTSLGSLSSVSSLCLPLSISHSLFPSRSSQSHVAFLSRRSIRHCLALDVHLASTSVRLASLCLTRPVLVFLPFCSFFLRFSLSLFRRGS